MPDEGIKEFLQKNDIIGGHLEVVDKIGKGGMGHIYKVYDKNLDIHRVVKVLGDSDHADANRFIDEARILARHTHSNIVQCHHIDVHEGFPYIVMEFVDGRNLREILKEYKKLPEKVTLAIAYFIADALDFTHNLTYVKDDVEYTGIMHRDIKPANILISKKGDVKVTDFGLAKPKDFSQHTQEGMVMGSLPFIAPEQFNSENIDYRIDIWALGSLMYELLIGKRPYAHTEKNPVAQYTKKEKEHYDKTILNNYPHLKDIIKTCLRGKPEDRFQSMYEIKEKIEGICRIHFYQKPDIILKKFFGVPITGITPQVKSVKPRIDFHKYIMLASTSTVISLLIVVAIFLSKNSHKPTTSSSDSYTLFDETVYKKVEISQQQIKKSVMVPEEKDTAPKTVVRGSKKSLPSKKSPLPQKPLRSEETKRAIEKKVQETIAKKKEAEKKAAMVAVPAIEKKPEQVQEATPKRVQKTFDVNWFLNGEYNKVYNVLNHKENLDDIEWLSLLGAKAELLGAQSITRDIKQRHLSDGYYEILKGKLMLEWEQYDVAIKHFSKAIRSASFHKQHRFLANFYLCEISLIQAQKNDSDKNTALAIAKDFISVYCVENNNKCATIKEKMSSLQ